MALIHEDGTGKADAESLCSVASADAYFAGLTGTALATAWGAASTPLKESALRQATTYFEGEWGALLPGCRSSSSQALSLPRSGAEDNEGIYLPAAAVWAQVQHAVAELAARALSAPLSDDTDLFSNIESAGVGSLSVSLRAGADLQTDYAPVRQILARILQPSNRLVYA